MNKIKAVIFATIAITSALMLLSLFLPVAAYWQNGWALYHLRIAVAICIPALYVIAALFYLLGLQSFKEELRRAYSLVAAGIILIGLCLLNSPIVTLFDLWDTDFMTYGVPNLFFMVPVIVLAAALSVFLKTLNIQSIWRKTWFNIAFVLALIALVVVSPHGESPFPELAYDIGNAMFALSSVAMLTIGIKLLIVRKHLTPAYAKVIAWLAGGVLAEAALIGSSIAVKALGLDTRAFAGIQDVLLLTAIPFIRSGYLFYQLTSDTRKVTQTENASPIDVVVYVASLASNKQDIDPMLDGLRNVTSRMQTGKQLSPDDQKLLGQVYLQLENYLEYKEKYRAFTKKQLRDLIYQKFGTTRTETAFWQQLPALV
jgi:hypothetical protein